MINHNFNAEGFQIVENLLNLASDDILQDTAETLAFVIRKFWLSPNETDNLYYISHNARMENVSYYLFGFLDGLSDTELNAAYGRNDFTAEEFHHRLYTHIHITGQPRSDIVCSVNITDCAAYIWLVNSLKTF